MHARGLHMHSVCFCSLCGAAMKREFCCNDIVEMRRAHPCGGTRWIVIRTGADIKIKCLTCGRIVMLDYETFIKRIKKVITT